MTGAGSLIKAQQKVSSGPRMLGEEPMEGSLPFLNSGLCGTALAPSPQECFLGLGQREGGESWARLQSWRITYVMLCLSLLLRAHPNQKDP